MILIVCFCRENERRENQRTPVWIQSSLRYTRTRDAWEEPLGAILEPRGQLGDGAQKADLVRGFSRTRGRKDAVQSSNVVTLHPVAGVIPIYFGRHSFSFSIVKPRYAFPDPEWCRLPQECRFFRLARTGTTERPLLIVCRRRESKGHSGGQGVMRVGCYIYSNLYISSAPLLPVERYCESARNIAGKGRKHVVEGAETFMPRDMD